MEREGFIKDSKSAILGVINGIIGSVVYELIIIMLISFVVSINNIDATGNQLQILVQQVYDSFPLSISISCLSGAATLVVFVFIFKWNNFKKLFKRFWDIKVVKYAFLCAFCMMVFSVVYNSIVEIVFELGVGGNANQENVVDLIKSNALLGFISVVVLAPIVEELTYRYCLFGGVCKYRKWVAYLVAGVAFMAMHGISSYVSAGGLNSEFLLELVYLPPYLFSGLALSFVYDKSNNLGSSVLAHSLNNLVAFLSIICL